jgi:hypothetical protein
MRIPIKEARSLAEKHKLTLVVIFGYDGKSQHVTTYGASLEQCGQAADFGNKLKNALGWPESMEAQPSRVRRLEARIRGLEAELEGRRRAQVPRTRRQP